MNRAISEPVTIRTRLSRALLALLLYVPLMLQWSAARPGSIPGLTIVSESEPAYPRQPLPDYAIALGSLAGVFVFALLVVFAPIAYRRAQGSARGGRRSALCQGFFAAVIPAYLVLLCGLGVSEAYSPIEHIVMVLEGKADVAVPEIALPQRLLFAGVSCLGVMMLGVGGFVALAERGLLRKRSFWCITALICLGTLPILLPLYVFSWSPVALLLHIAEPDLRLSAVWVSMLVIPYLLVYGLLFLPSPRLYWSK